MRNTGLAEQTGKENALHFANHGTDTIIQQGTPMYHCYLHLDLYRSYVCVSLA